MRLHHPLCMLLAALFCAPAAAGSFVASHYSELDGSFNSSLPGRVVQLFDQAGTQFTDRGINAFSNPVDGRITSVAVVDINNADANLVGIGLARHLYNGALDTSFQGTGKRVKDAYLTSVVDACVDPSGRIVVAGTTPGADGSAGNKDLALVRFNADGSDDLTFAGDGGVVFSIDDPFTATENNEGINDVDCLANGNLLVAGWSSVNGYTHGFIAEIASNGTATPVRSYGISAVGDDTVQVEMASEIDTGIVAVSRRTGSIDETTFFFLSPSANSYVATPGRLGFTIGEHINHCGNPISPSMIGEAMIANGDYAFSGLREDAGGNLVPFLLRVQFGELRKIGCTDVDFGVANALVTPPVALAGHVFVALGWQPFGTGPLTSRLRAYVAPLDGSAPMPAPGFGVNGVAQWSYPYNTGNSNNNRSFVQRLFIDPGYGLMAVGSRIWNGNDTDLALARFGSAGVFNDGFDTE